LGSSETRKTDVRIIAATNRDLQAEVQNGSFRKDLWYRLNIFPITMPPLRDRLDDIPLLVRFYIDRISRRLGKVIKVVPVGVMEALQQYHWPGNVRELENVLERAVVNSSGPKLHLADDLESPHKDASRLEQPLEHIERDYIKRVLEQTGWKVSGKNSAAEILGLDRSTLRARMRKLDIRKA
jgi:chemotaxis protein methyltransferase CheR